MKNLIEAQILANGYDFRFMAESHTNAGNSYYYDINGIKCRFSDHGISNIERLSNEVCFDLPLQKVFGLNGIKEVENRNKFGFFLLKEKLSVN